MVPLRLTLLFLELEVKKMENDNSIVKTFYICLSDTLNLTIFNTGLVCMFAWGIIERNMNPWHWFTCLGISLAFVVFLMAVKNHK